MPEVRLRVPLLYPFRLLPRYRAETLPRIRPSMYRLPASEKYTPRRHRKFRHLRGILESRHNFMDISEEGF